MADFNSVMRQLLSQYRVAQPTTVTAVTPKAVVNVAHVLVAPLPPSRDREQGPPIPISPRPTVNPSVPASIATGVEHSNDIDHQFVIRVFIPTIKREYKSYLLHLKPITAYNLRSLKEEILEQLGKQVICFDLKFDVGYMKGTQKTCFSQSDDVAVELQKIVSKGFYLWCDGAACRRRSAAEAILQTVEEEEAEPQEKRTIKTKKTKLSALDERKAKIQATANQLKEKHGDKYNMVQYKFWAEILENDRHKSWDNPPHGLIWGGDGAKPKYTRKESDADTQSMLKSVGDMARTIVTAIKSPNAENEPPANASSDSSKAEISPSHGIDLQDKLLCQMDMILAMFERGAITVEQFEKRRECTMKQLEQFD